MTEAEKNIEMKFEIDNPRVQIALLGTQDQYVSLLEEGMGVTINPFGNQLKISGPDEAVHLTIAILNQLVALVEQGITIASTDIVSAMKMAHKGTLGYFADLYQEKIINDRKGRPIRVKNFGQRQYVHAMKNHDVTFGIGPAGTGKTYLAVDPTCRRSW